MISFKKYFMCGIAGYIGKEKIGDNKIGVTLDLMKKRGPDFSDKFKYSGKNNLLFLHSRLSIIDLDKRSNQPFTLGDFTIVFNGEIYNYVEIREKLKRKGVTFKTDSDTEVLLQSYKVYDEECVKHFEGMWSFAIFDKSKKKLFLSRDRFGEKPLYYYKTDDGMFFASEIKFLKSLSDTNFSINYNHIYRYLTNGYKSLYKSDELFFNDIKEIPSGTNFSVSDDLKVSSYKYWDPKYNPKDMSLDDAISGFRDKLEDAVKIRLRSDVPMAFCLSGGVDSAALASIASKLYNYDVASFSIIDSDERYNEYENIKATVDDTSCKSTYIHLKDNTDNFISGLNGLIEYHDAPVYTISYYIHSLLSKEISKRGYKVVVSGTGADELVTGYYDHFNLHLYEVRNEPDYDEYLKNWKDNTGKFVRNPYLKRPDLYFDNPDFRDHIYLNNDEFSSYLKCDFKEPFYEQNICNSLLRNRMLNEMFYEVVPPILHEDDRNSMYNSLENRSPYLDSSLFDFAYSIPSKHLIQDGYGKYILRESLRGILNEKVRTDRQKKGFNASIFSLINIEDKKSKECLLDNGKVFDVFDRTKLEQLLKDFPKSNSYSKFLFNFINVKLFLETN